MSTPLPINGRYDLLIKLAVPVLIIYSTWVGAELVRVTTTRFTSKDGIDLERRLRAELPPTWLKEDIREIKATNSRLESALMDISGRLKVLEQK